VTPEEGVRTLLRDGSLEVADLGTGDTAGRLEVLSRIGRSDLSVGRLAEAHIDARAILAEAGRPSAPDRLHGVWAADRPRRGLVIDGWPGSPVLHGSKDFCTGVGICDVALVTAHASGEDRPLLVQLDLAALRRDGQLTVDDSGWSTTAFVGTSTGSISLRHHAMDPASVIGPPGWYLDRPGFWHGALGPAAVWAGGALGVIDDALSHSSGDDPHEAAHRGALRAVGWGLAAMMECAGGAVDADPSDATGGACSLALAFRYQVERGCREALERSAQLLGPGPLAFDATIARRHAELALYLGQSHGDRDLADLDRSWSRDGRRL